MKELNLNDKNNRTQVRLFQTVEKVQRELGFLSYMWYNVNGDENVGRKEKF